MGIAGDIDIPAASRLQALMEEPKVRHYRVDRDLGFAQHIEGRLCTVATVKTHSVRITSVILCKLSV